MRIARVLHEDRPRVGIVRDGAILVADVGDALAADTPTMLADDDAMSEVRWLAETGRGARTEVVIADARLLAPVARPGKVVAIGLNYREHATEVGMQIPAEPLIFAKFPSAIVGPDEPIVIDSSVTAAVDYEAELAVVIGRRARGVSPEEALNHVVGYTCLDDVSARDLQFADGQWVRGKSLDTFCPMGPWVVSGDDIGDPDGLAISCTVSGTVVQDSSTANLIFGVAALVSHISRMSTLEPGDVIATGTPAGVGWTREPRRLLGMGDVVIVSVAGIGELRNPVIVR